jgi:hypothetical protein
VLFEFLFLVKLAILRGLLMFVDRDHSSEIAVCRLEDVAEDRLVSPSELILVSVLRLSVEESAADPACFS